MRKVVESHVAIDKRNNIKDEISNWKRPRRIRYKEGLKNWLEKSVMKSRTLALHNVSLPTMQISHILSRLMLKKRMCAWSIGLWKCEWSSNYRQQHQGIRAAICWNEELASLARRHNDANVLCMPARFIDFRLAEKILDAFLKASLKEEGTLRRVD